jgi:hypothetical protein
VGPARRAPPCCWLPSRASRRFQRLSRHNGNAAPTPIITNHTMPPPVRRRGRDVLHPCLPRTPSGRLALIERSNPAACRRGGGRSCLHCLAHGTATLLASRPQTRAPPVLQVSRYAAALMNSGAIPNEGPSISRFTMWRFVAGCRCLV